MPRARIFLFTLFLCSMLTAQNVDSLKKAAFSGPDTSQVDALTQLAKYYSADDPAKALYYARKAEAGADELGDERRKAWALNYMGSVYYYQAKYDSSLFYHNQALEIRQQIDDPKGLGASYNNLGLIYDDQGKSEEALSYYLKALNEFEKIKFKTGVAVVYSSIGNLYYYQRELAKANDYFGRSLKENEEIGDVRGIMNANNNLALVKEDLGDTAAALELLKKSLKIAEEEGFTGTLITTLNNIGQLYLDQKKVSLAMPILRRAIVLCDSTEDETRKVSPLVNMGACFNVAGQPDSAVVYANEGLRLARKAGWMSSVQEAYKLLSQAYVLKNDFENAYKYRLSYEDAKDSVFSDEKSRQLTEMQTKYDTDRVLKDNQLKDERIRRQVNERRFIIAGGILAVIVSVLIYMALKRTKKLNQLLSSQKAEILGKNFDLEKQKQLIGEQKQEITSSIEYASHIQAAMLPDDAAVKKYFPDSFVFFRPRDIVSGDFYFISGNERQSLFAVADCTGHGVPGALMSMIGMEKLREAAQQAELPGEMLSHLNRAVKKSLGQTGNSTGVKDGMDIVLCSINKETRRMTLSGANRPLWVVRDGILLEYKPEKVAIGGLTPESQEFRTENVLLEEGDMVYLFTDGFADQFGGGEGKKFKSRQFRDLLVDLSRLPVGEQQLELERSFREWKGGLDQVDDVLVAGIRV